jgi:hypothetical protein
VTVRIGRRHEMKTPRCKADQPARLRWKTTSNVAAAAPTNAVGEPGRRGTGAGARRSGPGEMALSRGKSAWQCYGEEARLPSQPGR